MADILSAEQYAKYQSRVASFIACEGITRLSTGCIPYGRPDENGQEDNQDGEPWFSWKTCHMCGDPNGGMREYLFARDTNNEICQYTVCEDCAYYVNYGQLDDQTMQRIGG